MPQATPAWRAPRVATFLVFLIVGIGTSTWAPLVPDAKARLGLDDATLGALLLALGGGALVALPVAGWLTQRFGAAAICLAAGLVYCAVLPMLALVPTAWGLGVALAVFGASLGVVDIAMNAQAVRVEAIAGRSLMSGFHGGYSTGGLFGATGVSLLLGAGVAPWMAATGSAVLSLAILLPCCARMLPTREPGSGLAWPRGRLILLGALCCIAFLAEGVVLDWAGVLLRFHRGAGIETAGLAFACFSATMALARLTGDWVQAHIPPAALLRWGAGLAGAGYLLAAAVPSVWAGMAGCLLIGLGLANLVPVLIAAAARVPEVPASQAISATLTPGYAGLLAGPAIMGVAAELLSLPVAFGLVGVLMAAVVIFARRAITPGAAA
jgi:MFS family permease